MERALNRLDAIGTKRKERPHDTPPLADIPVPITENQPTEGGREAVGLRGLRGF